MRRPRRLASIACVVVGFVGVHLAGPAGEAGAQDLRVSAAWLGTAGTSDALLRGVDAVGGNPAALHDTDAPLLAFRIPAAALEAGLGPVGLREVGAFRDRTLPRDLRESWVHRAEAADGWRGAGTVAAAPLAIRVGPAAVGVRSGGGARGRMTADAVELLLFGNSGRTGTPRTFVLDGSGFEGAAYTVVSLGGALAVDRVAAGRLEVGGRLTWTAGHAVVLGRDAGTVFEEGASSLEVHFPIVESTEGGTAGGGLGLDLGVTWASGPWRWSLAGTDLVSGYEWNRDRLRFRPGTAHYREGEAASDFEPRPFDDAPSALRTRLDELRPAPAAELSAARRLSPALVATAAAARRFGAGLDGAPSYRVGMGAEAHVRGPLSVRGGLAAITGGAQGGAGVGLRGRYIGFDAAALLRSDDYGRRVLGSVSVSVTPAPPPSAPPPPDGPGSRAGG